MAPLTSLNPKSELARHAAALEMNISGARGLQEVMKTNLGPKGTYKLLVSGGGDLKLTKDGNVLLHEMQIQHPTASMIAKACTAQNDSTGDGTTSTVLLIGEMLKQAEVYISDGVHPRLITEGFKAAHSRVLKFIENFKVSKNVDRALLIEVAQTALRTKLEAKIADKIAEYVVDAILCIRKSENDTDPDLHMVEIQQMQQMEDESEVDSKFIRGLVLDHGGRHPDMPKHIENAYILTCNVSLEFEKTEVNSGLFYKTAAEREKLLAAEREFITRRVNKIVELKNKVCVEKDGKVPGFVVINQKGIDPPSLDLLAKNGILGLRRAKRRNMERLQLACGGEALNSVDDVKLEDLGWAGLVYEHVLGEDKFTFVEECKDPKSVTILIKGPNRHTINQIKDAIYDGLRAVLNVLRDGGVIPGAGSFEIAAFNHLKEFANEVKGCAQLGVLAYANALLVIPKTLAVNAGFNAQEKIVSLIEEARNVGDAGVLGLNLNSGDVELVNGIWDNVCVKRSSLNAAYDISSNLLEVDEVVRAGLTNLKTPQGAE
ncbi:Chaperonin Cpn60 TCP-1 domain containing protein [Aphelenchoides besseyi]|nr:Chaperonin Cpn60 TCP-1 domain containing protein [Aphelenchoides besseyi]KAI6200200.1 Chaperonin Cpn60 TCP-1 domain containing protein [Aphelenchoides besseyi]